LQFGQISIVSTMEDFGLVFMIFPFAQRNARRAKIHPGLGARQSSPHVIGTRLHGAGAGDCPGASYQ
jgi:hypothetical protein